ncbi:hypothetical protein GDO86_004837, partial [Hymenochirus boettgeri]
TGATPCIPQQCDKEMRLFCCFFISASHPQAEQLNASLSNIQWLGDMSSDSLGPCIKEESEKENQPPEAESTKMEDESQSVPKQQWPLSISERPPYSYMALIQFAINSTPRKRMTLKDIYTWIEDHFPYFKHVAKPGWKNSIRHNLSLHDMFVRETITNNKISYWTIHPQANRCLTLDQVFKTPSPSSPVSNSSRKCSVPYIPSCVNKWLNVGPIKCFIINLCFQAVSEISPILS